MSNVNGVYPRVCGGTRVCSVGVVSLKGLSPRVRGTSIWTRLIS